MNVSSFFEGSALSFSVAGEGVSIDPATGELSIATETLRAGLTVTVTAKNSAGAAEQSFQLTIAAEPAASESVAPPLLLTPPTLQGDGRVGETLTVTPGEWGGVPAPEITLQWVCAGAEIAGATGASYVVVEADDGKEVTCRVTAINTAGVLAAEPTPVRVTREAPVAVDLLADVTVREGDAPVIVEAATAFAGESLRFSVTGAAAEIDPATGVITLPTGTQRAGETVTVTAANSGGSAEVSFLVTIAAIPVDDFPPVLPDAAWSVREVRDAGPEGRRVLEIAAEVVSHTGFELGWYSGPDFGLVNTDWRLTVLPGETYVTTSSMAVGSACHNRLFWRRVADDTWAEASAEIVFEIAGLAPDVPVPVAPLLLATPLLAGTGKIGSEISVETGSWSGEPTPTLALQWLRDGAEIAGATAAAYVPGAEDDLSALSCRVTASNLAGSVAAETAALAVSHVAPEVTGELYDEVFDQGTGPETVATAAVFAGESLAFAVSGAGAVIDPKTGVVTIPTDIALDGETVTVTASNSGGSAEAAFLVTIEAALDAGFPLPLDAADWSVREERGTAPAGRRAIEISGDVTVPEGFELRWYSGTEPGGVTALSNRVMAPGETFVTTGTLPLGATCHNLLHWRRVADDSWAEAADEIVFEIAGLEGTGGGGQDAPSGTPAATENRSSVSQDGVTFNFSKARPTGQYPDGTWWVQSPVTITSITPNSVTNSPLMGDGGVIVSNTRTINGAMVDWGKQDPQTPDGNAGRPANQGFDSQIQIPSNGKQNNSNTLSFFAGNNVDPNIAGNLVFGSSQEGTVLKVLSMVPYVRESRYTINNLVPLTVVKNVPTANAFRPGSTAVSKASIWVTSSLDMSIFPNYPLPRAAQAGFPGFQTLKRRVEKIHTHMHADGTKATMYAVQNQPGGGAPYARDSIADQALALCTNALTANEKRTLAEMMVQQGIDVFERANQWPNTGEFGGVWADDGQLNPGRKGFLVLAALLLNDSGMKSMADGRNLTNWRPSARPTQGKMILETLRHYNRNGAVTWSYNNANYVRSYSGFGTKPLGPVFQEDRQTFYVNQWHINNEMKGGGGAGLEYLQSDLGKPEWSINAISGPQNGDRGYPARYRQQQRQFQMGLTTAMWLTDGAYDVWNWPPLFDYVDYHFDWHHNVITNNTWAETPSWHIAMYDTYRSQASQPIWPKA